MKNAVVSFIVGVIFALGLGISGMTDPQNVIGFLDLTGDWNPSLMLVMVGAIAIHFVAYRLLKVKTVPVFEKKYFLPERKDIDLRLLAGAALFGAGWGLAGYCPGPAITSLISGQLQVLVFVIAMLAGMLLFKRVSR